MLPSEIYNSDTFKKKNNCVEFSSIHMKKSLKIPQGISEAVNRRTDNAMAKRKQTKRHPNIYNTFHRKQKIEQHGFH
jgi:hypothetical protein